MEGRESNLQCTVRSDEGEDDGHVVSAWPAQIIYIIFLFRGEGNWMVTSI